MTAFPADKADGRAYHLLMNDALEPNLPTRAPQSWIDSLERARADMAAGRTVPSEVVFRRLDESIARMMSKRDARDHGPDIAAGQ